MNGDVNPFGRYVRNYGEAGVKAIRVRPDDRESEEQHAHSDSVRHTARQRRRRIAVRGGVEINYSD